MEKKEGIEGGRRKVMKEDKKKVYGRGRRKEEKWKGKIIREEKEKTREGQGRK